jgi:hypothetical protein
LSEVLAWGVRCRIDDQNAGELVERAPRVEAAGDGTAEAHAGEAPAENLPQVAEPRVEVAVEAERPCGEDDAPEPGEPATVEVSSVAAHRNPAVQYRLESVPGHFPPKYRRVPVQEP